MSGILPQDSVVWPGIQTEAKRLSSSALGLGANIAAPRWLLAYLFRWMLRPSLTLFNIAALRWVLQSVVECLKWGRDANGPI